MQPKNPASNFSTEGLQQVGYCESCGEPAYSTRWGEVLVIETNDDGSFRRSYAQPTENPMCMRHKGLYMRWQEEQRRKYMERRYPIGKTESKYHYRSRIDDKLKQQKGTM